MADSQLAQRVESVRSFNRFYTRQIGVLKTSFLDSGLSLTEVRVLYELAHSTATSASELGQVSGMDAGQLSRILSRLAKRGLVDRQPSPTDGRQSSLSLTAQGRETYALLNERQASQVEELISRLTVADQDRLVRAMDVVRGLLTPAAQRAVPYVLRPPRAGDLGWVVAAHGRLYAEEYGWNAEFEGLVASIIADFIKECDPRRERCWIAERDGENVGSVFIVKHADTVAKLRLFLVEPKARGLGIGRHLVDECVHFSRQAGYRKITLWTNSVLSAARRIYERAGFRVVETESHHSFGHDLVSETWELEL